MLYKFKKFNKNISSAQFIKKLLKALKIFDVLIFANCFGTNIKI